MRKCTVMAWAAVFLFSPLRAQTFSTFLSEVTARPHEQRQSLAERFRESHPASPLYESDSIVVFVYTGPASAVSIAGDANGWRPVADRMTNVAGTTLWYAIRKFEPDARLDYKYVINDSAWVLDPANPRRTRSGFGENSELRMPAYPDQPELTHSGMVRAGTLRDTVFRSDELGNERRVVIYTPAGYDDRPDSLGLVVVHDGLEFISIAGMPAILDNLIASGRIPPVLALFIPPIDRTSEYAGEAAEAFTSFIVHEVIPGLRQSRRISQDPSRNVIMGASNGGNISLFMGLHASGQFGNVAAFSSNVTPAVAEGYSAGNPSSLRIYLDIGTYDIPLLKPRIRGFHDLLQRQGYVVMYREHHDGHSWANWRAHIDDALGFLLSRPAQE